MSSIANVSKPVALIFLEVNGVLFDPWKQETAEAIREITESQMAGAPSFAAGYKASVECFSKLALQRLQTLIERVEKVCPVRIIFSSIWGQEVELEELTDYVLDGVFFTDRIVDKIPPPDFSEWGEEDVSISDCKKKYGFAVEFFRGRAVDYCLREHYKEWKVESFVILDADETAEFQLRYPKRFVQVNADTLLSEEDVERAVEILTKLPFSSEEFPS